LVYNFSIILSISLHREFYNGFKKDNEIELPGTSRFAYDVTRFYVLNLNLFKNEPEIGRRPIKEAFYL
jgi:hypothetical protein